MNNFRFYIFGVPNGFNLYPGDADETNYFQSFYDRSKEHTKLTIERRGNGDVSYSYLKYRLFSVAGRPGAFFGMSIVLKDEYCFDVNRLYRLFDTVYTEVILKSNTILETLQDNPHAQAKFLIHTFKDRETEIRTIETIFQKNLENKFSAEIHPLDISFKPGKPNLVRKMNINKSNEDILEALQIYRLVSLSDEYSEELIEEITEKGQKELQDKSIKIKDAIIDNYTKLLSEDIGIVEKNIASLQTLISESQQEIKDHIGNQPELEKLQNTFIAIEDQLNGLINSVKSKVSEVKEKDETAIPPAALDDQTEITPEKVTIPEPVPADTPDTLVGSGTLKKGKVKEPVTPTDDKDKKEIGSENTAFPHPVKSVSRDGSDISAPPQGLGVNVTNGTDGSPTIIEDKNIKVFWVKLKEIFKTKKILSELPEGGIAKVANNENGSPVNPGYKTKKALLIYATIGAGFIFLGVVIWLIFIRKPDSKSEFFKSWKYENRVDGISINDNEDQCIIGYKIDALTPKKNYSPRELLEILNKRFEIEQYGVVGYGCLQIVNCYCATDKQKEEAKILLNNEKVKVKVLSFIPQEFLE